MMFLRSLLSAHQFEVIGMVVVGVLTIIGVLIICGLIVLCIAFLWQRWWLFVADVVWHGDYNYRDEEKHPSVRRMKLSGVALALSYGKFSKIPVVYSSIDDETLSLNTMMIAE